MRSATLAPNKSTNDRSYMAPSAAPFDWAGLRFQLLGWVAPEVAQRRALARFMTPPKPRIGFGKMPEFPHLSSDRFGVKLATSMGGIAETTDLTVTVWGRGPAVYLLHGWGGRSTQWSSFVEPLTRAGLTAVAFDAPGHRPIAGPPDLHSAFRSCPGSGRGERRPRARHRRALPRRRGGVVRAGSWSSRRAGGVPRNSRRSDQVFGGILGADRPAAAPARRSPRPLRIRIRLRFERAPGAASLWFAPLAGARRSRSRRPGGSLCERRRHPARLAGRQARHHVRARAPAHLARCVRYRAGGRVRRGGLTRSRSAPSLRGYSQNGGSRSAMARN